MAGHFKWIRLWFTAHKCYTFLFKSKFLRWKLMWERSLWRVLVKPTSILIVVQSSVIATFMVSKTDWPKVTILRRLCLTPSNKKKPATRNYFQISNDWNCRDFSSVTYLCQKPVISNDKCRNNSTSLPVHSIYCSCSARYENECRWTGPPYWYAPVYIGAHFHDFKALFYFVQWIFLCSFQSRSMDLNQPTQTLHYLRLTPVQEGKSFTIKRKLLVWFS